jgi:ATP-dependent Lon protease
VFICIPITKHNKLIFVINGYIENQDVMISQKYSITAQKYDIISKQISSIEDLSMSFKKMFLKTLTLKQLLCVSNNDIIKCCYDKWSQYTTLMVQSISDMITHFLNGNTRKKIEILSCLLYNHKNTEAIFRVQMLWNLIIDESNVIKQRTDSTEREIVNRMHPELLIHLNHMTSYEYNTATEEGIGTLTAGNEQTSYEKRIAQSNTDTVTKQKMLDKLKELSNKNSDNNSKAQQYLDGILNIPFGKVAKEAIICENDKYTDAVNQYMSNLVILCLDFKDTYSACNDLLVLLVEMHGLEMHMLLSFTNEIDTETYILSRLANRKIKTALLTVILDVCNKFIHAKLTISPDIIDTLYLITFLKELNTDEQCDICQLYNNNYSSHSLTEFPLYNTANNTITFDTIINTFESATASTHSYRQLKADIISILTNESYFYDTGIPLEIIRYKEKLVGLLSQNKELIAKKKEYLTNCYKQLDKSIHGQPDAKDQIIRIMGQWLNGNQSGYCIGFEGAPGVGKTSLAKYGIANALLDDSGKGRPFGFIALGGSSNGSTLEGHSYTYVGSTWGRIVDIIMTAGVMNPIIFIDELDKISTTESGRELIGILTHITDKTQNMEFMDKYFADVKIDLSQVLFVFSYNDYSKLDSILADRIHRIKFDNYSVADKITICNNYLVPKIQDEINVNDFECVINPHTLRYIIESYTYEAGVRKLKEKLYDILREINIRHIKGELNYCNDELGNPYGTQINITPDLVDTILNSYYKVEIPRPMDTPFVGVVYGLYATAMGTGGITIIQVTKKYTDSATLLCTGNSGDVMLESMKVSLTLAINILAPETLAKWGINHSGDAGKFGLHIHCPDGATPKDGPSAGCAFTVALFSLLTGTPVLNTVSMTGEIDIMGNVLPIGGLDSKIQGSVRSGIYNILVPIDNKKDIIHIQRRQPEILEGVNIIYTKTVHDVLKHSLVATGIAN